MGDATIKQLLELDGHRFRIEALLALKRAQVLMDVFGHFDLGQKHREPAFGAPSLTNRWLRRVVWLRHDLNSQPSPDTVSLVVVFYGSPITILYVGGVTNRELR